MRVREFLSANRWPMFIVGLLAMSVTAQGVLVFVATRPGAPRPLDNYYQRSLEWDADASLLAASRRLGWRVELEIPAGSQYDLGALRPVDIVIRDSEGREVGGLVGRLIAARPADARLTSASDLTELPHAPGHYRTLAHLPVSGLWELSIDATREGAHFIQSERITLPAEAPR